MTDKTQYIVRQGDVLLEKQEEIPEDFTKVKEWSGEKDNVLAFGEATGHAHRLEGDVTFVEGWGRFDPFKSQRVIYAVVGEEGAQLTHEEHDTIVIPGGIYRVRRQQEYLPGNSRMVYD